MPPSICNFQFSIFNLQLLLAVLVFLASPAAAEVQLPEGNTAEPISITAQAGNQWQLGAYEVWLLRGDCVIQQGQRWARSREAVLWIDRAEPTEPQPNKVIAYLEGNVEIVSDARPGAPRLMDQTWFGRLLSAGRVEVRAAQVAGRPATLPAIYWRGMERRTPEAARGDWRSSGTAGQAGSGAPVQQAQYTGPMPAPPPEVVPAPRRQPLRSRKRRLRNRKRRLRNRQRLRRRRLACGGSASSPAATSP